MNNKSDEILDERIRIGFRISEIRKSLGYTQEDLAKIVEITQSNIARIELGKYNVGYDTLQKIAKAFNMNIDFILTENLQ